MIKLKRVYEKPSPQDGTRILVERLWPRGLKKQQAALDIWLKDAAPTPELRKWFAHDPAKWKQFKQRYWQELHGRADAMDLLSRKSKRATVTFIYAARDKEHNAAVALRDYLKLHRRTLAPAHRE